MSIFIAIGFFIGSGLCALGVSRYSKTTANFIGALGAITGAVFGLAPVIYIFFSGVPQYFSLPWSFPYGSVSVAIDYLSAFFLFPVFVLSAAAALYGYQYLLPLDKKPVGVSWLFFNVLIVSMILVITARNAILFLLAWELMTVSSFFLVTIESEKDNVQKAGLVYLVATHIGTSFLFIMFILLGAAGGSFEFMQFKIEPGFLSSAIFLLAVAGFGTKAGLIPFHVWLPEAHPAAPSYVSAIMSGVMIKTGIYGLIRILTFLGTPPLWWAWLLIIAGISSALLGVLFALAQHDLKRLLAYSSIENIGIIVISLGIGVFGLSTGSAILIVAGFTAGLLHVTNHAFFKGLLFLGAGAVLHATLTREINVLGGLIKKMPWTGFCFLIGAAAISGLPPLNGFISEFLIYFAAFKGLNLSNHAAVAGLAIIAALAMIGTLGAACFVKAFGIIFLGEPRSAVVHKVGEVGLAMRISMLFLAGICFVIGVTAPYILGIFNRVLSDITRGAIFIDGGIFQEIAGPLISIVRVCCYFFLGLLSVVVLRRNLLSRQKVENGLTWDCGYAKPDLRMQYTASSLVQPLTDFFHIVLRSRKQYPRIKDYFPQQTSFATETPDTFYQKVYRPFFESVYRLALKLRWFQHGRLQPYILYILVSLLILIMWKL